MPSTEACTVTGGAQFGHVAWSSGKVAVFPVPDEATIHTDINWEVPGWMWGAVGPLVAWVFLCVATYQWACTFWASAASGTRDWPLLVVSLVPAP